MDTVKEIDLGKIIDDAIESTIKNGLNEDKEEIITKYGKDAFNEMQLDYRYYGTLFSFDLKENIIKEFMKLKEN